MTERAAQRAADRPAGPGEGFGRAKPSRPGLAGRLWSCHALRSVLTFTSREATRPDHPVEDLRTRFVVVDRSSAWRHVQACVEGLDRHWRIEEETPASEQFHLTRKTLLRWFTSDVRVWLWPAGGRRIGVDLVSTSRVGRIDFGQNARNIRDFYRALETYLQRLPGGGEGKVRPRGGRKDSNGRNASPAD